MKKRSTNIYPKILLEETNNGYEYLYGKEQEKVTNKILLDRARVSQKKKIIQLNETIYQFWKSYFDCVTFCAFAFICCKK